MKSWLIPSRSTEWGGSLMSGAADLYLYTEEDRRRTLEQIRRLSPQDSISVSISDAMTPSSPEILGALQGFQGEKNFLIPAHFPLQESVGRTLAPLSGWKFVLVLDKPLSSPEKEHWQDRLSSVQEILILPSRLIDPLEILRSIPTTWNRPVGLWFPKSTQRSAALFLTETEILLLPMSLVDLAEKWKLPKPTTSSLRPLLGFLAAEHSLRLQPNLPNYFREAEEKKPWHPLKRWIRKALLEGSTIHFIVVSGIFTITSPSAWIAAALRPFKKIYWFSEYQLKKRLLRQKSDFNR